jgi:hypothetical protein
LLDGIDYRAWCGGFDSLALFQVEDGVVAKQDARALLCFALFVFLGVFPELPEDNLGAVLSLLDVSAECSGLTVGEPKPRAVTLNSEKENIDSSILLLADEVCGHFGTPRLAPRRYTRFKLLDDGFSNDFVCSRHDRVAPLGRGFHSI